jgi:hypothetical protein
MHNSEKNLVFNHFMMGFVVISNLLTSNLNKVNFMAILLCLYIHYIDILYKIILHICMIIYNIMHILLHIMITCISSWQLVAIHNCLTPKHLFKYTKIQFEILSFIIVSLVAWTMEQHFHLWTESKNSNNKKKNGNFDVHII